MKVFTVVTMDLTGPTAFSSYAQESEAKIAKDALVAGGHEEAAVFVLETSLDLITHNPFTSLLRDPEPKSGGGGCGGCSGGGCGGSGAC